MSTSGERVKSDDERKLFIGALSLATTDASLRDYFSEHGDIEDCCIMRHLDDRSKGYGFITFKCADSVENVINTRPHVLDRRQIDPKKWADSKSNINTQDIASDRSNNDIYKRRLFVGGLSQDITESDLREYFKTFGCVTEVMIVEDAVNKRSRGFGFITFTESRIVEILVGLHHVTLKNKLIECKYAEPRKSGRRGDFNHYNLSREQKSLEVEVSETSDPKPLLNTSAPPFVYNGNNHYQQQQAVQQQKLHQLIQQHLMQQQLQQPHPTPPAQQAAGAAGWPVFPMPFTSGQGWPHMHVPPPHPWPIPQVPQPSQQQAVATSQEGGSGNNSTVCPSGPASYSFNQGYPSIPTAYPSPPIPGYPYATPPYLPSHPPTPYYPYPPAMFPPHDPYLVQHYLKGPCCPQPPPWPAARTGSNTTSQGGDCAPSGEDITSSSSGSTSPIGEEKRKPSECVGEGKEGDNCGDIDSKDNNSEARHNNDGITSTIPTSEDDGRGINFMRFYPNLREVGVNVGAYDLSAAAAYPYNYHLPPRPSTDGYQQPLAPSVLTNPHLDLYCLNGPTSATSSAALGEMPMFHHDNQSRGENANSSAPDIESLLETMNFTRELSITQ